MFRRHVEAEFQTPFFLVSRLLLLLVTKQHPVLHVSALSALSFVPNRCFDAKNTEQHVDVGVGTGEDWRKHAFSLNYLMK